MTHIPPFTIYQPQTNELIPIVINVPHAGVWFPPEDQRLFKTEIYQHPPDTDWFVDQLFDFAPGLGASFMKANLSRYVIDLNRPITGQKLYDDGRFNPGLLPEQTFDGQEVYREIVDIRSLKVKRTSLYYEPYYENLGRLIQKTQAKFGHCLLIDAHSIKRNVPSIRQQAFPDIILGTNQGKSCHSKLVDLAKNSLQEYYDVAIDDPFQGGNITRFFGQPENGIHCIQIEISQDLYLDEANDTLIPQYHDLKNRLQQLTRALALAIPQI